MRKATARARRLADNSPYELAEIAARREGLELDEWLEQVVAEAAADRGLAPDELEPEERLDAIAKRLMEAEDEPRETAAAPRAPGRDPAHERRLETAIERLSAHAQTSDARTAQAFESLTHWLERSEADRERERSSLRALNERLANFESRPPSPSRDLRSEPPPRDDAGTLRATRETGDAVGRIARRQAELDARQAAAEAEERRKMIAETAERERERQAMRSSPRDGGRGAGSSSRAPSPQDDADALGARLDRMRAKQGRRRLSATDAEALRAGLAAMSRSVADMAPRNAGRGLQGAVGDLGDRLSRARDAGADGRLVAPVEAMLRQVLDALKAHDPRAVADTLERDLKAIGDKVEALARSSVAPDILEAIQRQSNEVNQMLAAAARNTVPVARLENQIQDLAERVDRLAHDPSPHSEVAELMQTLAEAQAQIERSTPTSTLRAIERRIEDLAARIDEAVRRPPSGPEPKPAERTAAAAAPSDALEAALREISAKLDRVVGGDVSAQALAVSVPDMKTRLQDAYRQPSAAPASPSPAPSLAQRIETVRSRVERPSDVAPRVERLEAVVGELAQKLQRPAPASRSTSEATAERAAGEPPADLAPRLSRLETAIGELARKLERPAPATPDARPVQELAQRIDSVRATIERQSDVSPRVARLEAAIGGLSEKLERPAAAFDPRPLEDLSRRIEGMRSSLERQGGTAPRFARIEATLDGISEKLERPAPASEANGLNATLRELTARIEEAFRRPPTVASLDPRPLEDLAKRIEGVRETVERQGDVAPQVARLQATLGGIAEKLERPAARIDTAALNAAIDELPAKIQQAIRQNASAVVIDPAPMNDLARRIETMRAIVERQSDWGPQFSRLEIALAGLAGKLERTAPGFDASALVGPLEQLATQIEDAFRRQPSGGIDPAPLEDIARRVDAVRVSVERQTNWGPQFARLEDALRDLTAKLERAPQGLEHSGLIAPLEQLAAQIEDAFRRQPAGGIEPAALEDLASGVESVRATLERQTNWGPQFERLEQTLGELAEKFERASPGLDASALAAPLERLAAQVEEAFRRPQTSTLDPAPLEDLARQVEGVRASLEKHSDLEPQFARLEAAFAALADKVEQAATPALAESLELLGRQIEAAFQQRAGAPDPTLFDEILRRIDGVQASVERPGFTTEEMSALVGAIEDLSERVERGAGPADLGAVERRLDEIAANVHTAAASPLADLVPLERALREISEKMDRAQAPDLASIEAGLRALFQRIEETQGPEAELDLVERAADIVAQRVEQKVGTLDADVLASQISEIHARLDALGDARSPAAGLERTLDEIVDELEALRRQFEGAASHRSESAAGSQVEQANFDRRMDARFAGVQATLDRIGERVRRIEDEVTSVSEADGEARPRPAPAFSASFPPDNPAQSRMRDIPDRLPVRAPERAQPERLRAPQLSEKREAPLAAPAQSPAPKHAAINAHIQAARRAASAAFEEAARREESAPPRPRETKSGVASALQTAQSAVSHYRRPLLLGGAGLLAALTALAVVTEYRGKHAPLQKSEFSTPEQTPLAETPPARSRDAGAVALDPAPIGAVSTAPKLIEAPVPSAASPAASLAAPEDLVAGLPTGLPTALRDSAAKGDSGSQIEIALRFIEGRGVPRDMKLAARWLELAAAKGAPFAQYRLGALYEKGVGVTRDASLARNWYTKAADAGNARAMHNLAVLDAQDGGAGKPDYAQAANWFKRAAALGVRDSQFNLGVLYGRGLGVPLDLAQSWMWFSLAAQQGDGDAAHKRDEVANRLDGKGLATATKALAEFKPQKPSAEANDAPPAPGGLDAKGAPAATAPATKS